MDKYNKIYKFQKHYAKDKRLCCILILILLKFENRHNLPIMRDTGSVIIIRTKVC